MKWLTWLFVIVSIAFICVYTYDYLNLPKINNIDKANDCITLQEKNIYGIFKQTDYQIYIPKEWPFVQLNSNTQKGSFTFGVNKDNTYEFLSIWSGDYNKTNDQLLLDTLKSLSNYNIIEQTKTINNTELKRLLIQFKTDSGNIKQEIYTFVKDNKGYIILARVNQNNYSLFKPILDKITCSFTIMPK